VLSPPPIRRRNPLLYFLIALALATAAVAVWFSVAWLNAASDRSAANTSLTSANEELKQAEQDPAVGAAKVRDEVTKAGKDAIVVFHTLDYRHVDEGLDQWEKASTGALHDDVLNRRASSKQAIEAAKTATTGEVLSAALTDLDDKAGTATMIAAVKVLVTADGKAPEPKFLRIQAALQRTGDGWKLNGIGQVDFAR
jgi:Mce-associated membrane protein